MYSVPRHELCPKFSHDERSRKGFISNLRAHVLSRQAARMREMYDDQIVPAHIKEHGHPPQTGEAVHKIMKRTRYFRFFSSIRTSAQEMVFASVIAGVERELDQMANKASALSKDTSQTNGTLTFNDALDVPRNVSEIDVHLVPGSYHTEYGANDVAAGAIYDNATPVFAFRQFGDELNDIGMTLANYVRLKYPQIQPQKILDAGCTVGHNTVPWATTFPDAEVHAIDVAPSVLRYGNARAQAMGVPIHFHQMNATSLDFPDNHFDVVCSSMFLHELPIKDIKAFFKEANRVLKPGGLLWNMELPPNKAMGAYESFYLDWDSYYNNEPFYKPFRDQDYPSLCVDGGFDKDDFIQATLPRYTFVGEEEFNASIDAPAQFDNQTGRMDPKGTRWYCFGAFKNSGA